MESTFYRRIPNTSKEVIEHGYPEEVAKEDRKDTWVENVFSHFPQKFHSKTSLLGDFETNKTKIVSLGLCLSRDEFLKMGWALATMKTVCVCFY
jgi:hypothetical protein